MANYTIPPGNKVAFPFSSATPYTIPAGDKVPFRFGGLPGTVFAVGSDLSLFGTASIVNTTVELAPAGINDGLVSGNLVVSKSLLAQGFTTMLFGQQALRNNTTIAAPSGFDASAFGTQWASFYTRFLNPSGFATNVYGTATLSGGVRIAQMNGFDTAAVGTPSITYVLRQLFPQWFVATGYGIPVMGYERPLAPAGIDSLVMGSTTVFDNTIRPTGIGFDASIFGATEAYLYTRTLQAKSVADLDINNIGFPHVINVRQYITPEYRSTDWIEGSVADPISTNIRNVNRVVDLIGNGIAPLFRQVPETASVDNKARAYHLDGFDATQWGTKPDGTTFIAWRNRSVAAQGFEPIELSSRFHIVRNAAYQILPVGFDTSAVGTPPLVVNTRRSFYVGGLGDQTTWGVPFVAPGVRTLLPAVFQQSQEIMGVTTIWYRVRELGQLPPDFPSPAFGIAQLDIHLNIVAAKSIPSKLQFGTASVRNNTPEVTPLWDSDSFTHFGAPAIFNKENYFPMQGDVMSLFGLVLIDYRTKTIPVPGFDAMRPNNLHKIQKTSPDPPMNVTIEVNGFDASIFGGVATKNNAIFGQGFETSAFGTVVAENRGIFPIGIPPPIDENNGTQFGTPVLPMRLVMKPEGIFGDGYGKLVLDPRTIWAPRGAPQQAIDNHDGIPGDFIDGFLNDHNGVMPVWGSVRIENKNRIINEQSFFSMDSYGIPSLVLKIQYAYPNGQVLGKFGYPELFGGDREVLFAGFDLAFYGKPTIGIVEPRNRPLFVGGLAPNVFGTTTVSNFIRTMPVSGLNATLFGQTWVQRPPPPALPNGLDATLWGNPMIAYRIRHVMPDGTDTFTMDYELGSFKDRMRVKGTLITPSITGGDLLAMGTPTVDKGNRGITLTGFAGVMGAPPVVRRINRVDIVSAGRFDVYGDPWALATTQGTIQPRGEDFLAMTLPSAAYQLRMQGWAGEMGMPRVAQGVGAVGFDPSQFGQVVAVGFGCGRQARVMRGWDSAIVGAASMTRGS